MSMSQEEIEALMNGIELDDGDSSDAPAVSDTTEDDLGEESTQMSADDIESLINQTQNDTTSQVEVTDTQDDVSVSDDDIEAMLASIGGVTDNTPPKEEKPVVKEEKVVSSKSKEPVHDDELEKLGSTWASKKVEEGIFPYPVTKDHKPINQLSEVANDSEEKASKIFDVLSFILDENNVIQQESKKIDDFLNKQIALMEALSAKFPNIEVFNSNHQLAVSLKDSVKLINSRVDAENMQLFEAMELMQFHDINRQKIERVMAVIRKLSGYLNNLFEDDGSHKEVAVAKHIHGDVNTELVGGDDLEALIAEFNKQ